jgi:hypothetical protein
MALPAIETSADLSAYAAVISAGVAVLAVVVGPLITLWASMRQLRSTVLSSSRQRWIDELRQEIAGVLNQLHVLFMHLGDPPPVEHITATLQRYSLHSAKITLLINPAEKDHLELNRLVVQTLEHMADHPDDSEEIHRRMGAIADVGQRILKREWARVKQLR